MSRRRGLTPEDERLWARVTETVIPLRPDCKNQFLETSPDVLLSPPRPAPTRATSAPAPISLPSKPGRPVNGAALPARRPLHGFDPAPTPGERLAGQPVRMHHNPHRQLPQGKLRPETRIDLHGMTLSMAQPALARFILDAHIRGCRLALVITGKGRTGDANALMSERRPGALRHNVPHWLHMAPLSSVVLQVTPAHRRHGGEGAYYVYLRKPGGGI